MSKNENERGNISFTKTGYMQVIREVRKLYNAHITKIYQGALELHAELAKITGRGANDKRKALFEEYQHGQKYLRAKVSEFRFEKLSISYELWYAIKDEMFRGKGGTLCKPRKSAFKTITNKEASFSLPYIEETDLSFSLESLNMSWSVGRNNRSVERAHENAIARLVFDYLGKYKWRRGEGGVFYHDDEYAEDAARENGCGYESSISCTFGPRGKEIQDEKWDFMHQQARRSVRRSRKR